MILLNRLLIAISLITCYLLANPTYATPLQGYVSNPPQLCIQRPKLDPHGKPLIGHASQAKLRGLIGITFNPATGEIEYVYPDSKINKFNVKAGDFILRVEKEDFRPCIMPSVTTYPMGFILLMTIRQAGGKIITIPVELEDYRRFTSGDS
jgi:hypothetical protein